MNIKLVDSLVQIIESLNSEERKLLEEKLGGKNKDNNWQEKNRQLLDLKAKIFARRQGKPFDPPLDIYIQETREERTRQQDELIVNCFAEKQES